MPALRLTFLASGAAMGLLHPFLVVILQTRGFSAPEIGVVTALGGVGFALAVPVWGHLGDVTLGRARAFQFGAIGAGAAMVGLGAPVPGIVIGVMVVVYFAFQSSFSALGDALAVSILPDPGRQYGRIRLLQSLAFAVATISAGFLYNRLGYGPAPLLWGLGALLTAAGLIPLTRIPQRREVRAAGARGGSIRLALASQPRLWGVLVAVGLTYIGIMAGNTYIALRLVALGGQSSDVALSAGLAAFAEIPAMAVGGWLARRIGLRALFAISALVYAVCILSWTILGSPEAILATRLVTGLVFAEIWMACVFTMRVLLPDGLQASGQALYQTTAAGVGSVVANGFGGILYGAVGPGMFAFAAVATFIGAGVAWATLPHAVQSRAGLERRPRD